MTKNITLSMPDELAKEMEKMSEVNWSAVARKCIGKYVARRKNPDISTLLKKLQNQKGEEYVTGRRKAEEIAEVLGYHGLNLLLKRYNEEVRDAQMRSYQGPIEPWEYIPSSSEIIEKLLIKKGLIKDVSDEFLRGLKDRLLEIENVLSKEQR